MKIREYVGFWWIHQFFEQRNYGKMIASEEGIYLNVFYETDILENLKNLINLTMMNAN